MQPISDQRMKTISRKPLIPYLLLTFGSAWLIWLPLLFAEYAGLRLPVPPIVLIVLGSFVPSLAALFLTWRYAGTTGLRQLLGRAFVWRVAPIWYVLARQKFTPLIKGNVT
jgi:hypothetical protein